jgi:hypothetical protein
MNHFSPHLEILPAPQRALWNELSEVSREFVLYGETALALHLAHRQSVDFDLYSSHSANFECRAKNHLVRAAGAGARGPSPIHGV